MPCYTCNNCNQTFQRKENLDYHTDHNVCRIRLFRCKYCVKTFTTSANMYRHMKYSCKIKKQNDSEKETILEQLVIMQDELNEEHQRERDDMRKEIESLKNEVETLKKTRQNKMIIKGGNNQINTGTVNNTNNIILVGYGQEDLSKLDKTDIMKALQNGYYSTVKLTEAVHFNPKYPEYHNVYISNMKDKYAMMFDGKSWTLTTKEDLINKIYDDKKNYIEENLEEFVNSLPPIRKRALHRWLDTDDEDQKIKEIKENIKLLLYNSRQIACDNLITVKQTAVKKQPSRKVIKHQIS